jgi:hypothetical protein
VDCAGIWPMDNLERDCEHIVQLLSTNEGINMDIR